MQSHIKTNEIQLPEVSQKRLMSILRRKIMEYESEKFPVSVNALRIFIEGNKIKENLVDIIDESLTDSNIRLY